MDVVEYAIYRKLVGGSGGGVPEHTHDWNDKPFGCSEVERTLYHNYYDVTTSNTITINNANLQYFPTSSARYILSLNGGEDTFEFTYSGFRIEDMVYVFKTVDGMTMEVGFYSDSGSTTFNLGREVTYEEIYVEEVLEQVNQIPMEYFSDEFYNDINNRINAVIEEALGGEY